MTMTEAKARSIVLRAKRNRKGVRPQELGLAIAFLRDLEKKRLGQTKKKRPRRGRRGR